MTIMTYINTILKITPLTCPLINWNQQKLINSKQVSYVIIGAWHEYSSFIKFNQNWTKMIFSHNGNKCVLEIYD